MNLEDLRQLNEEIIALAQAGVPLGPGLLQVGSNRAVPHRMRRLAASLGERVEGGEAIEEALRTTPQIPPVYAAMVEIGNRSGNLAVALESMTSHLRRVDELRRLTISSMTYPIIVIVLACLGFAWCISPTLGAIEQLLEASGAEGVMLRSIVQGLQRSAPWLQLAPLVIVAATSVWWFVTRRAAPGSVATVANWLGWIPGARQILRSGSLAMFANLLNVMTRHQVPIDRSVVLAAEATGNPKLICETQAIALALRQGARSTPTVSRRPIMPATMRWLIESARSPQELARGLERLGDTYLRQVHSREVWTRTVFPVLATALVGGTATVAYALAMMGPWMSGLWQLSQP